MLEANEMVEVDDVNEVDDVDAAAVLVNVVETSGCAVVEVALESEETELVTAEVVVLLVLAATKALLDVVELVMDVLALVSATDVVDAFAAIVIVPPVVLEVEAPGLVDVLVGADVVLLSVPDVLKVDAVEVIVEELAELLVVVLLSV